MKRNIIKHTSKRGFITRPKMPPFLRINCPHILRILDWLNKPAKAITQINNKLCNIPTYISIENFFFFDNFILRCVI